MIAESIKNNWVVDKSPKCLEQIHSSEINIAIYNRNIDHLSREIIQLIENKIELRASGKLETIITELNKELGGLHSLLILQDIEYILSLFSQLTKATSFRLLLATVNTNMCRRFHTDINDLRLLCTYSGPGTLWLTEDNINHKAMDSNLENEFIVLDESRIQQANTGSVIILKGALYPQEGTKAVVHRSPTIEETGQKRLLLRIDTNTNEFFKF